jgi:hypothetical protein
MDGRFVDAQSMCCNTVRDEKGICCKSGILDECHICDGDSTSCATNITVTLIFDSELAIPHNDSSSWKPFMVAFIASVSLESLIFLLTNFIHSACNTCSPFPELVYIYCTNCSRIQCYSWPHTSCLCLLNGLSASANYDEGERHDSLQRPQET